ncbi:urea ABC transporter permease subunit UrtB [Loktanella sp. DJP18]|uniref:urea ABC transporter permease subunit UrtB n=1 Tax=Loktanella sp. DJP18 TaxID=3409788 RepID=UPI003BB7BE59
MRHILATIILAVCLGQSAAAQDLQPILQTHAAEIADPSRGSVAAPLDAMIASGLPQVPTFLERWTDKGVWQRDADGVFFYGAASGNDLTLTDIDTGEETTVPKAGHTELRPNGGVRRVIGTALVQFQLTDPDIARRLSAIDSLARRPDAEQLAPLLGSIEGEPDPALKARKIQLANFLSASFAPDPADRIAAIDSLAQDTTIEARAVLNQILTTRSEVATTAPTGNVARILTVGDGLTKAEAYDRLIAADLAPPAIPAPAIRDALAANIVDGRVGDVPLAQLGNAAARERAYATLAAAGTVPPRLTDQGQADAIAAHTFAEVYVEDDPAITDAARAALTSVETRVAAERFADLALDALSLASIYFLAAIGLAITFGVMGVINMAHGEFIMMGAYTGYVIQQVVPDYTLSLIVALPVAFAVTFAAGVTMERLVIRHLYHRPLETLLATFGISIALQQLAKNIFGTQARPLTSPGWLDGALVLSDVVQISYIRIAIFVLALLFLGLILFILKRTRLGLEVRAVTQNPGMAASMGIDPDRINMLTFGLGSGIAGIAGVAIGLYAKVTSEMGADYIVQSFMTVVVGGVGNVWGTLAGATLIGFLQKGIEFLNPSNTLAAQTYMVLFIILFIQFRPKGIVAQNGRAAAD